MGTHYVQYHKDKPSNEIKSRQGAFEAWAKVRPKQPEWSPPAKKGDIIWLLSGRPTGVRPSTSYRLKYYFKAQDNAQREDNHWVIRGAEGRMLENGSNIGNYGWFKDFFKTIGNGRTSFQKIPETHLHHFLPLMSGAPVGDRLNDAIGEAEKTENDDDVTMLKVIKTRRGQVAFRKALLDAYDERCCFSGCKVVDILEAAHISPHSEETNYEISNGLLLRADIHTLFDLHLIAVDKSYKIRVSKRLRDSEYQRLEGESIGLPGKIADHPRRFGLADRLKKLNLLDENRINSLNIDNL